MGGSLVFLLPQGCACAYACEHTCDMHFLPPQGVHDVRLAYIQFALSFLIAGDDSTVTQVLELKGRRASLSWGPASP